MKIKFCGAAGGNVIPSRFLLQGSKPDSSVLIDCGDIVPDKKNAVHKADFGPLVPGLVNKTLLTHGHTDHVGALCDFVHDGFKGGIISTRPTEELTQALLEDNFHTALVDDVFELYESPREFLQPFEVVEGMRATFYPAQGHILGASSILLELEKEKLRVLFSGDLGNTNKNMLEVKGEVPEADIVVIESTYGRREHHPDFEESLEQLYKGINETYENNGNFYIPVLSINRLQEALYYLNLGIEKGLIPSDINIVVDSTLGEEITKIYDQKDNKQFFSSDARDFFSKFSVVYPFRYTTDINKNGRNIILASSGLDGLRGRFRKHLKGLTSEKNSIAVVSHTLEGSLLNDIALGKDKVGTNGGSIDLKAKSFTLSGFSSHADATQLISWLEKTKAKYVFLVHGEDDSRENLKQMIIIKGICPVEKIFMPAMFDEYDLTSLHSGPISTPLPNVEVKPPVESGNGKAGGTTVHLFGRDLTFSNLPD